MENKESIEILTTADESYFQICIEEFVEQGEEYFNINSRKVGKTYEKTLKILRLLSKYIFIPRLAKNKAGEVTHLSVQIGPDFSPILKESLNGGKNYMYFFDCWLPNINWVIDFSRMFGINTIFFSTKQATEAFKEKAGKKTKCKAVWIPEGFKAGNYSWYPANEKDIDVLEFGRRYAHYHNLIKSDLESNGYCHKFSEGKKLLFPDEVSFREGLAKAKISICFPSSITHPERAGEISTMTLRYLQSMASKSLIVGKLPYDMQFLFDYNPVVEIEEGNESKQIVDILKNYDQYARLIEKNYQTVLKEHQWSNRIKEMLKHMQ